MESFFKKIVVIIASFLCFVISSQSSHALDPNDPNNTLLNKLIGGRNLSSNIKKDLGKLLNDVREKLSDQSKRGHADERFLEILNNIIEFVNTPTFNDEEKFIVSQVIGIYPVDMNNIFVNLSQLKMFCSKSKSYINNYFQKNGWEFKKNPDTGLEFWRHLANLNYGTLRHWSLRTRVFVYVTPIALFNFYFI